MCSIDLKILYGPYEANGVIKHKKQRLRGLLAYLKDNKYIFESIPSEHLNRLSIVMNERLIYTCDIRTLQFNVLSEDDILCQRIIDVIKLHESTFTQERNVPKFPPLTEKMRWQKRKDLDGIFMDDTSLSEIGSTLQSLLDYQLDNGDEDDLYESHVIDALHHWDQNSFLKHYVYNYGCFMQEPIEGDISSYLEEEDKESEHKTELSSSSSCICLLVDPPSLYSICQGPSTSITTEAKVKSGNKAKVPRKDREISKDLNENARVTFEMDEWKDMLSASQSSKKDVYADVVTDVSDDTVHENWDEIDQMLLEEDIQLGDGNDGNTFDHASFKMSEEMNLSQKELAGSLRQSQRSDDRFAVEGEYHSSSSLYQSETSNLRDTLDSLQQEEASKGPRRKVCRAFSGGKCISMQTNRK